jgi:hypothetical protein
VSRGGAPIGMHQFLKARTRDIHVP